jgi:hypothetical protein
MAPKLPDEIIVTHTCGTYCNHFSISQLITFQHREFLRSNFARLFADRWIKKSDKEILKPIGKASTNPNISKLKLAAKTSVEEILKSKLAKACSKCNESLV